MSAYAPGQAWEVASRMRGWFVVRLDRDGTQVVVPRTPWSATARPRAEFALSYARLLDRLTEAA